MSTTRREFLKSAGYGAAAVAATTGAGRLFLGSASAATVSLGLVATDGYITLPGRPDPVVLPATSPALYLVQRLRDEAHRFAITYHRDLRRKAAVKSAFDDLPGIGPARKRALLRTFGSAKRVREAPVEQIAAIPGIGRALAERIKAGLAE